MKGLKKYYNKYKYIEHSFHNLMPNKVKNILFVSSFYDAFIFEQDGRLSEKIYGEYRQLNLSTSPRIDTVSTGTEALDALQNKSYQLVILMMRVRDISPFKLSKKIKIFAPEISVLLLLSSNSDIIQIKSKQLNYIDETFLWNGDTKLFLAMIKSVEDKKNIEPDIKTAQIRVILLVEDSINFYSNFLPILYSKIVQQTQNLIEEQMSDIAKRYQMRIRPKVILVHNYEDAVKYFNKYKDNILSVITDIRYPKNGVLDEKSGIFLAEKIQKESTIPILMLSSEKVNEICAKKMKIDFLYKSFDKTLNKKFRLFMENSLGFGKFIFKNQDGVELLKLKNFGSLVKTLSILTDRDFLFNVKRKYFSSWLLTHGHIEVVNKIPSILKKYESSHDVSKLREDLSDVCSMDRINKNRGKIINFNKLTIDDEMVIHNFSGGSLGGKGRGLAFLNALLTTMDYKNRFEHVEILLPKTFIVSTNEYDDFLENLDFDENSNQTDRQIKKKFLAGELSGKLHKKLEIFLELVHYPLAVRSSGMLEDSQFHSFAGVYNTVMLPNSSKNMSMRLQNLENAIKMVFASVFFRDAKSYIEGLNFNIGEEKMAVIIQQIVGKNHDDYFYPHIAGVAQSYNYYPIASLKHDDGIAEIVLGLGELAVNGQENHRFCPSYPKINYLQEEQVIQNSQKKFIALNLDEKPYDFLNDKTTLVEFDKDKAFNFRSGRLLVSTWDSQNYKLQAGYSPEGIKIITFDNILKYDYIPLAPILGDILEMGEKAMGTPVEIEFALVFDSSKEDRKAIFYLLQIRPLSIDYIKIKITKEDIAKSLITCSHSIGNGIIKGLFDIIYMDIQNFDNTKTYQMISEIELLNRKMIKQKRPYILIGFGRWGSRDRFLGVPVNWGQISGAKVIIELSKDDYVVEPSQGTHFFHNIVSMNVGYLTIQHSSDIDKICFNEFEKWEKIEKTKFFTHVRSPQEMIFKVDSKTGTSIVNSLAI